MRKARGIASPLRRSYGDGQCSLIIGNCKLGGLTQRRFVFGQSGKKEQENRRAGERAMQDAAVGQCKFLISGDRHLWNSKDSEVAFGM